MFRLLGRSLREHLVANDNALLQRETLRADQVEVYRAEARELFSRLHALRNEQWNGQIDLAKKAIYERLAAITIALRDLRYDPPGCK